MLDTYTVPLHLKNKVKEIGYSEINRVRQLRFWKVIALIGWILFFIVLFCWLWFPHLEASQVNDNSAIKAIMGESSNQGYQGMLAVAVGIRNRGTLQGVYGLKAKHIYKEPQWVWDMAKQAWQESKTNCFHSGTHWENIKAFGKPYWLKNMILVYHYKDHNFYKAK